MTASSLSRVPASIGGEFPLQRAMASARLSLGVGIVLAVLVVAVVSGNAATFDPAPLLLFGVVVGAALGGRRGGVAAAAVASMTALAYFAQPAWVDTPGNAVRVLLFVGSAGLTVLLVGTLREAAAKVRNHAGEPVLVKAVQAFAASVGEAPDDHLLDTVVESAKRLLDADLVVVTVFDPRSGQHVIRAVAGSSRSAVGVEVLPGVGITGQAIRDRRPVISGDSGMVPADRPLASVPAMHAGRVVATLTVGRDSGKPAFNDQARLRLDLIAPTLALTVSNWMLRRQVREASIRDPLSGVYNRAYFDAALEQLLALRRRTPAAERRPISMILFDLDEFRAFNEEHGRKAGDTVVRAVGTVLRQRFRQSDLIGRIDGDGFLVVLDGATLETCSAVAAEIRARIHALAITDERGARLEPSISAGCATFHANGERSQTERSETMIHAVEAALDTARWSGPGAIVAI